MKFADSFKKQLHSVTRSDFQDAALEVFEYQWHTNELYQAFCMQLGKNPANVRDLTQIPFLPISLFKTHDIQSGQWQAEKIFLSSGTTQANRSKHLVRDISFYQSNCREGFISVFGPLEQIELQALLPSYQAQGNSSLIAMVDDFMQHSMAGSNYYLHHDESLVTQLQNESSKILLGVSFALLDFCERQQVQAKNTIVMETGGMKGRRKEMIRPELHALLGQGFAVPSIASEYGMTELLSQAYSLSDGVFRFPPWAMILVRDVNDPLHYVDRGRTGGINIVDLANVDTCAFIETQDLGKQHTDVEFEVLGRFDNTDIRGCNLLI